MLEWRIPLLNATCLTRLQYGKNLYVRKAKKLEIARWQNDSDVRDVVPYRVLPSIDSVLVCHTDPTDSDDDRLTRKLMVWFAAASLFAAPTSLVEASFFERWHRRPAKRREQARFRDLLIFPLSLPASFATPWRGPIQLDVGRHAVVQALRAFRAKHSHAIQFHFALSRWFYSLNMQRRTIEDAIIDLTIGLEAVFVLPSERGQKEQIVRERVAAFWFETEPSASKSRRKSFKWKISQAYKVRSSIVHGDILDPEALRRTRDVLDQIMRHVLYDFIAGYLSEWDPAAYWTPAQRTSDFLE